MRSPLESPRDDRLSRLSLHSGGNLAGAMDALQQRPEQGAGEDGETFYSPGENPKTRTLNARASNPFNSRPPAATVGDVPLSLLHSDDEERQPLRELFFASGAQAGVAEGGAEHNPSQDSEQLPAAQPPPRLSRHQQAMQAAQRARAEQESERNQVQEQQAAGQQEQDDLALAQQLQEQEQYQQPQSEEAQLPQQHDHLDQQRAFNSMHGQELIIESDIPPTPEMAQQYKWAPKEAGRPNPYANSEFAAYGGDGDDGQVFRR